MKKLNQYLYDLILETGLSFREFARRVGMSSGSLMNYFRECDFSPTKAWRFVHELAKHGIETDLNRLFAHCDERKQKDGRSSKNLDRADLGAPPRAVRGKRG